MSGFVIPNCYESLFSGFPKSSKTSNAILSPEVLNFYLQQQQLQLQLAACGTSLPNHTCLCQSSICHPHLNLSGILPLSAHSDIGLLYPQLGLSSTHPSITKKESTETSQSNLPLLPLPIRPPKFRKNVTPSSLFDIQTEIKPTKKKSRSVSSSPPSSPISSDSGNESSKKEETSPRSAFHSKKGSSGPLSPSTLSAASASPPLSTIPILTHGTLSSYASAFSPPIPHIVSSPCSPSSHSHSLSPSLLLSLSPASAAAQLAVAAAVAAQLNRSQLNCDDSDIRKNRGKRPALSELNAKKSVKHACTFPNCGNGFPTRFSLKRHMKRHTGERPFLCPWEDNGIACGRKFGEKSTLKRHLRIHTGEKPFRCSFQCVESYLQIVSIGAVTN